MAFFAYPMAKQTCLCDVSQLAMNLKQLAMQMMQKKVPNQALHHHSSLVKDSGRLVLDESQGGRARNVPCPFWVKYFRPLKWRGSSSHLPAPIRMGRMRSSESTGPAPSGRSGLNCSTVLKVPYLWIPYFRWLKYHFPARHFRLAASARWFADSFRGPVLTRCQAHLGCWPEGFAT